eukprot:Nk52_evm54s343 gene=Nk52_evmTU54s343
MCDEENTNDLVYLDYNATTPIDPEVVRCITESLTKDWGNPSSNYPSGIRAKAAVEKAREQVGEMIGAAKAEEEIVFTSGGTEANNWVIRNAITYFREAVKDSSRVPLVLTTNVEHPSVENVLNKFEKDGEINVVKLDCDANGKINIENFAHYVTEGTKDLVLVTVMLANNETGVIQDLEKMSQIIVAHNENMKESPYKVLFHTDAAQAVGKVPITVQKIGVDYLTIVGHKFYAPRVGALYCRKHGAHPAPLFPMLFGGGQERGLRSGTENTPMIVGLGKACSVVTESIVSTEKHLRKLRDYLEDGLVKRLGELHVVVNCKYKWGEGGKLILNDRLPNTCNVSIVYNDEYGRNLLDSLKILGAIENVCISKGAACHSSPPSGSKSSCGSFEPSQILLNSGVGRNVALSALRISVGKNTQLEDIDRALVAIERAVNKVLEKKADL